MSRAAWLVVLLASVAAGTSVQAQQIDLSHGGPLTVTAQNGLEWRQNEQEVIARGDARATRGDVTVSADKLVAYYRKKPGAAAAATPAAVTSASAEQPAAGQGGIGSEADASGNEIYRVEAIGNVHIFTPTDRAQGDRAIYDIDQSVMLLTGHDLKLTTPSDVLTAKDSLEYWSGQHMAVARGDAVVVTNDAKRLAADTLVAYTDPGASQPGGKTAPKTGPNPAPATATATPADPLAASGRLKKVDAFGHVSIRTATDIVTGDRAVYVPDSGIARVGGNVRITRGENQLNGSEAEVNLKTNVSRLLSGPHGRVQGLVVPNDPTNKQPDTGAAPSSANPATRKPHATKSNGARP